jgi:hypothetical protein
MTTKVKVECPDSSHWHVRIEIQDNRWDPVKKEISGEFSLFDSFILKPGDSRETYITSTRRLMISEVEPCAVI